MGACSDETVIISDSMLSRSWPPNVRVRFLAREDEIALSLCCAYPEESSAIAGLGRRRGCTSREEIYVSPAGCELDRTAARGQCDHGERAAPGIGAGATDEPADEPAFAAEVAAPRNDKRQKDVAEHPINLPEDAVHFGVQH